MSKENDKKEVIEELKTIQKITGKPLKDVVELVLKNELERIKHLEEIYMTGGKFKGFSESFKDSAIKERERLCRVTGVCYSIIRSEKTCS